VQYRLLVPTPGPYVDFENVREVVYFPSRGITIQWPTGGNHWREALSCIGYLVLDDSDEVEKYFNFLIGEAGIVGAADLFVYYTVGLINRCKRFKGVIFGFGPTLASLAVAPDAGGSAGQRLYFRVEIATSADLLGNFIITTNG
jgi:hypothetical protein